MSLTMSDEEFEQWWGPDALAEAKARPLPKPVQRPTYTIAEILERTREAIESGQKAARERRIRLGLERGQGG